MSENSKKHLLLIDFGYVLAELETCYSTHDNVITYTNAENRANSSNPKIGQHQQQSLSPYRISPSLFCGRVA